MKRILILLTALLLGGNMQATPADTATAAPNTPPASTFDAGGAVDTTSVVMRVKNWYFHHLNYGTVSLLMGLESSFIPFPSEIVVPPAAWASCDETTPLHTTDSKFVNIALVVLFATLGAIIGALINYFLSYFLGRPFIYWFVDTKVGHLLMLSGEKVRRAEDYFVKHGRSSTFIGRLVPVVRQFISIHAGLAKMPILPFIGYTALGAGIWNIILALVGYFLHGQEDLINKYIHEISWVLLGLGILFVAYLIWKGIRKRKRNAQQSAS